MIQRCILVLCMLCGLLIGCGFHPRGNLPLAPPLQHLYLQAKDPYGQLSRYLKDYLKASNVQLASSPQQASVILVILKDETSQQLLSVGGTQQTRQYNLILHVTFQLNSPTGQVLLPEQTVMEARAIPIQSDQILAGSNEANNLYRQMRQAAAYDIMNHLSAQNAAIAVEKAPKK